MTALSRLHPRSCPPGLPCPAQAMERASDPAWLALGVGVLAANLQLSAAAYASGTPFSTIHLLLGTGEAVWMLHMLVLGATCLLRYDGLTAHCTCT